MDQFIALHLHLSQVKTSYKVKSVNLDFLDIMMMSTTEHVR